MPATDVYSLQQRYVGFHAPSLVDQLTRTTRQESARRGERGSPLIRASWLAVLGWVRSYRVNEKVDGVHVPQLLPTVAATLAVTPDVVIV